MADVKRKSVTIEYPDRDNYVCVEVPNGSMKHAGIVQDSIIIVRFTREAEEGSIVLFAREGALYLRRVKRLGDVVLLMAEGDGEMMQLEKDDFIVGKVVQVRTYFEGEKTA